jgi:outer membrane protein
MKKFTFFVTAAMLFLLPLSALSQVSNLAYVDLQRIMVESEKGKEARKTLTDEAERLKKSLDAKQEELQKMKDTLEKQGAMITPDARAEKDKQYQAKVKDYQRVAGDYQAELQQKDGELTQKILKEVEEVIKGLGEREKYSVILERGQAGIIYASPALDITSKVISLYNESAKKRPTPAKK